MFKCPKCCWILWPCFHCSLNHCIKLTYLKHSGDKLNKVATFSTSRCHRLSYTSYLSEVFSERSSGTSGRYIFLLLMTYGFVEKQRQKYVPETEDQSYVYYSRAFTKYPNALSLYWHLKLFDLDGLMPRDKGKGVICWSSNFPTFLPSILMVSLFFFCSLASCHF